MGKAPTRDTSRVTIMEPLSTAFSRRGQAVHQTNVASVGNSRSQRVTDTQACFAATSLVCSPRFRQRSAPDFEVAT